MRPKALIAWSSGKDSAFALHEVRRAGDYDVVGALTTLTETFNRVSMHGVRAEVLEAQLAAVGLPGLMVRIPATCTNERYEAAMAAALAQARAEGVSHIVFGDLYLPDVRAYREEKMKHTGIVPLFPLWNRPTATLAREMIAAGFAARLASIDLARLPSAFAGRAFEQALLDELPEGVDPCGENGEFHTCVTAGPIFSKPICVVPGEMVIRDGFAYRDLLL